MSEWYEEQQERDLEMYRYWLGKLRDVETAKDVAERQLTYLARLIGQHSLEKLGYEWSLQRDQEEEAKGAE